MIRMKQLIGDGYDSFWHCRKRYRAVKGSRGSKKSCTTAIWYIYYIMKFYHTYRLKPHLLVIRRFYNTHKNSTRAQLVWAINKLGVRHLWNIPKGDNTLTYLPSGQQILFRGLDDPQSITSITVEDGYLCWVWFEEAFQITSEDDFNKVDMSIRGALPAPLFKQITLTFNPWSDRSWLKRRFFDSPDENTLAITTTYKCNEFLGQDDISIYEEMKKRNPKRYRIEGLGEWGIAEGLIFENWEILGFDIEALKVERRNLKDKLGLPAFVARNGLDFGYNDPTAFIAVYVDKKNYEIYVYYCFCEVALSNNQIYNKIYMAGFGDSVINADSEDLRTINELKRLGLKYIRGAKKGQGSVLAGIQKIQDYKIYIHPSCQDMIVAIQNYAWKKDKVSDKIMNEPEHDFSHLPDALRYAMEDINKFGIMV